MALVHQVLFPMLLESDDNNEIFSKVLESWEQTEDGRTITLNIKPDLEWNDGTPISSADVLMSLTLQLDPNISQRANRIGGVVGQQAFADGTSDVITGLSAPDDLTVVVELEAPNFAWIPNVASLMRLTPILPAHVLADVPHSEIPEHEFFETFPVTAGPYDFVEYVPQQYIEFRRNPNWSLGEAGFEQLFMKVISGGNDALTAQLEAGEIQFMTSVNALDADRVAGIEDITVTTAEGQGADMIQFAWDNPIFEDPRVRQAIMFASDREGICEQVLEGFCTVPLENMRVVGLEWSVPDDVITYNYDPDRARQLLQDAGWDPNTQLTFAFPHADIGHFSDTVTILQANWADVGLNFEVVNMDQSYLDLVADVDGQRSTIHGWTLYGGNFTMDPSSVQAYASCDSFWPGGANLTWYCNPEVDELWAAGLEEPDQAERGEIYQEIFRTLNADPFEMYLFVVQNIVARDNRLMGVKPQGDPWNQYWNIGEWYWED